MATIANVLTYARTQAQTDSNGLTDAKGIIFANEALLDFRNKLITNSVDAGQLQESYADFTAGVGVYSYPSDMWRLKTISVNYTDTNASNYFVASQVDVSNLAENTSFMWLRGNAAKTSPYFDDRGNTFEVFPTPKSGDNVSQAIRIFYFKNPTEFTATSDTVAYPESLDYRILGWRIASNYYYSIGKMAEGDAFNAKYDEKVKEIVKTLARGSQQPLQALPIQWTGWQF